MRNNLYMLSVWMGRLVLVLIVIVACTDISHAHSAPATNKERSSCANSENPALTRFSHAITFYVSFDGYAKADMSAGKGKTHRQRNDLKWGKGLWGESLLTPEKQLRYFSKDNADLSSIGSIVMWVSLSAYKPGRLAWAVIHSHGYVLYLERNAGKQRTLVSILDPYPGHGTAKQRAAVRNGTTKKWKPGSWHLLAVNWTGKSIGFSVDGAKFKYALIPPHTKVSNNPSTNIYIGAGDKRVSYRMDELFIFNRMLTNDEVKWIYDSGRPSIIKMN